MWIMTNYHFFNTDNRDIKIVNGMLFLQSYQVDESEDWNLLIQNGVEEDLRNKIQLGLLSNKRLIDIRDYESIGENK